MWAEPSTIWRPRTPDQELVKLGEEIIELSAAWPGTGLEKVGEFARDLGAALAASDENS